MNRPPVQESAPVCRLGIFLAFAQFPSAAGTVGASARAASGSGRVPALRWPECRGAVAGEVRVCAIVTDTAHARGWPRCRNRGRSRHRRAGAIGALFLLLAITSPARAAALALVLAVDVSESVSSERYLLQHEGIARAFESPLLLDAIATVPGGIEALVLEWSDPDKIAITVGWTRIGSRATAAAFAASLRATKRSSNGLTAIGSALLAAAAAFDHLPEPAGHRVIDVSGDGMANFGVPPSTARDTLVGKGITINGLAILSEEPWLDEYYRSNVIGGPAAFVAVAKGYDSFADAILRKLVQEVAGAPTTPDAAALARSR